MTLRDYKNALKPSAGFNPEVVTELVKKCKDLSGIERYVVFSFDEIKIQSNLVFDKHSGDVIGFVDVGDNDLNFATFSDMDDLATHVLSFYVRSFVGDLKFNFAYFGTNNFGRLYQ